MPKWAADVREGRQRQAVRRYRNPNRHDGGYVYRSVTNVTGALPKMALLNWYALVTAEAAVREHDAWINMMGTEKQTAEDKQIEWLKQAHSRVSTSAAAFGTTVHAVIENLLQGKTYDVERLAEPWVAAAEQFVAELRPRAERLEASVYDERTLCAGTFDFLGRLDSAPELGRCLIDWKTSKGVYPDQAVQLVGGYLYGSQYVLEDSGKEIDWREPDSALIVHFTADGYEIRPVEKDKQLRRAFLGALEIRKWEENGSTIGKAYKLHVEPLPDPKPSEFELQACMTLVRQLSAEHRADLMRICAERNVHTRRDEITVDDLDFYRSMAELYMREDKGEAKSALRPMP